MIDSNQLKVVDQKIISAMISAAKATWMVRSDSRDADSWSKEDRTPVTVADLASQAILLKTISEYAPGELVLAEEDRATIDEQGQGARIREIVEEVLGHSCSLGEIRDYVGYRGTNENGARWFVDPLDGTKGFVKGLVYAVAVARHDGESLERSWMAVHGKKSELPGVVGNLFRAIRGEGAYKRSLSGSSTETKLAILPDGYNGDLLVAGSRAHGGSNLPPPIVNAGINAKNIPLDSQAKYAAVADGEAHVYVRRPSKSFGPDLCWDHAPGTLLLEETGGIVTDLHGKEIDFTLGERMSVNQGILAVSHKNLHAELQPLFNKS
ncbi:hypothetical protein K8I28_01535 [bacterium]|nr:hypothetical protein [bacterium]